MYPDGIYTEGLTESVSLSKCSYWGSKINTTNHDLARHATLITKSEHCLHNTDAPHDDDKTNNLRGNTARRGGSAKNITYSSSSSIQSFRKNAQSPLLLSPLTVTAILAPTATTSATIVFTHFLSYINRRCAILRFRFGKQSPYHSVPAHSGSARDDPH